MTQLKFEKIEMPAASFDYEGNPLPQAAQLKSVPWPVSVGEDVLPEDREYINYGCKTPLLPYTLQDRYDRKRKMTVFSAIVLENEFIRAAFLPEFGAKLYSLIYKPLNRELLYVNPVFQPANLAYRDAWLSGGVEWNMGMPAHNPFTCDKPFVAAVSDGRCPVLRVYEWERIRNAPFQIDFYLPPESPFLHVRTKLINPYDTEIPGYWFSNIAVAEHRSHRVLAPAQMAYTFDYSPDRFGVKAANIPVNDGIDVTYPTNLSVANDFFFRLGEGQWPWITSLDENGQGLIQASTSKLQGRKLFVWGMSEGGRRWQDFLTEPGNPYVEIQAGLGRTQVECRPLPPQSETQWLEVYGYIDADGPIVHGSDWKAALNEVEGRLREKITPEKLEEELDSTRELSLKKPENIIQYGSGWGDLELELNPHLRKNPAISSALPFARNSMDEKQEIWLNLLKKGVFSEQEQLEMISSYQISGQWRELLEQSIKSGKSKNWTTFFHLGLMYHAGGDINRAKEAFAKSTELRENHWALRMLAHIAAGQGQNSQALDYMDKGWKLCGLMPEFAEEYAAMLADAGNFDVLEKLLASLPQETQNRPRLQIAAAQLAFSRNNLDEVEKILDNIELVNIRECETTLTDIWFEVQAIKRANELGCKVDDQIRQYAKQNMKPPVNIDFRMN